MLSPGTGQVTHALLTRPPLTWTSSIRKLPTSKSVRLACVKHAASVHPEPGSNSHVQKFCPRQLETGHPSLHHCQIILPASLPFEIHPTCKQFGFYCYFGLWFSSHLFVFIDLLWSASSSINHTLWIFSSYLITLINSSGCQSASVLNCSNSINFGIFRVALLFICQGTR